MHEINNINTTTITGTTTWAGVLNLGVRTINAGSTSTGTTSSLNQINVASTHTFYLPAVPYEGQIMVVAGGSLTSALNILTISGNGKNIEGLLTKTLTVAYSKQMYVYNGTEWLILSLI